MSSIDTFTDFHIGGQKLSFILENKMFPKLKLYKNVKNKQKMYY